MARNSIGTTFGQASCDASMDIPGGNHCNIAIWFVYFRPYWCAIFGIFSDDAQLAANTLLAADTRWFKVDQSLRY
jgi:hypothetical protein